MPDSSETTVFVYDAAGKTVAEYSTVTPPTEPKAAYLTNDHLGSPRITTDELGQVISRRDFMPFGEEIYRSGYGSDSVRQKFTGYERDSETGLDFAQARYFNSGFGRFSSPDPLAASATTITPQSWNRYSYSYNNPLRFTDPSGMIAGDFYNLDGIRIGTDGKPDSNIYIVYDKSEATKISKFKVDYTDVVNSKITLPNTDVVGAIGDAFDRSEATPFTGTLDKDAKASGGFSEASVTWKTKDGKTEITALPNGPETDPRTGDASTVETSKDADGKAHIHGSGKIVTTTATGKPCDPGSTCMGGGSTKTQIAKFTQEPSEKLSNGQPGDFTRAIPGGVNITVGASSKKVYFYNRKGIYAEMKLSNFLKIGGR